MKSEDVARYLHDHPEFFDQYAEMLTLVTLPDPHSGRAISITEKQLFNLRDKVRTLEAKLVELIGFGEENDSISDKVHGLAVALIAATDHAGVVRALYSHLGGAFAVPHVGLRLWGLGGSGVESDPVSGELMAFAAGLTKPYCGAVAGQEALAWFGESGSSLRSMAQVPLREAGGLSFGLLVMASEEPTRFYPELGTLYLERIGEMAAAALLRVAN
ncbi:MAG: DUF484 family protein [Sulfuritalea sp.]|jgi:uncharacterized protein YigA (DUF484 family)|nr:DUF484 family protein [Sulfuritalea sp.]MBK9351859.1 DUF484 family protein [Sulfuritalea sp.]MBP7422035.1 DUF484 family protein [Sulfuritalea sp.]